MFPTQAKGDLGRVGVSPHHAPLPPSAAPSQLQGVGQVRFLPLGPGCWADAVGREGSSAPARSSRAGGDACGRGRSGAGFPRRRAGRPQVMTVIIAIVTAAAAPVTLEPVPFGASSKRPGLLLPSVPGAGREATQVASGRGGI